MASSLPATTVSAPGKIILFGEHSVVYGKVAIASSVNLRTKLVLNPVQTPTVSVSLPDIDLHAKWDVTTLASCRMTGGSLHNVSRARCEHAVPHVTPNRLACSPTHLLYPLHPSLPEPLQPSPQWRPGRRRKSLWP